MTTIYHSGTVITMDGGPDDGPDAPECVVIDGARIVYGLFRMGSA
ncbi:hypothetical protein [Corynebacterium nuruki]